MNIGLFEDSSVAQLFPLTWLRTPCELLCGCDRLIDKVQALVGPVRRIWTRAALQSAIAGRFSLPSAAPQDDWLLLNAATLATGVVKGPAAGVAWMQNGRLVAVRLTGAQVAALSPEWSSTAAGIESVIRGLKHEAPPNLLRLIEWPWDLIAANRAELIRQCSRGGAMQSAIGPGVHIVNPAGVHVGANVTLKPGVVLDAEDGPIHVSDGAQVQANAVIVGPCFVGDKTIIRPTAVIRENTSIGPVCRVGGEVEASILLGYSNKQHDGFLGHSCVGAWVNLGADTVTSDLKNTYGTIRVAINGVEVESGQRFIGSFIGDHAKTGIGTILPTGCVIGVASNVFRRAPIPRFVPSFGWLTDDGLSEYRVERALEIATTVMSRRQITLSDVETELLRSVAATARHVEAAGWKH